MNRIEIHPKNGATVYVTSDNEGILHDLHEYLTFFVDGYQHQPKFIYGSWDGKIRLYSLKTREVGRGLIHRIKEWAGDLDFEVWVDPVLEEPVDITPQDLYDYITSLKISTKGKPIEPYEFQWLGMYYGIRDKRYVFEASTAGGKSLIMYGIVRYLLDHDLAKKVLLVTDGQTLVGQLKENFVDYATLDEWNADAHVHEIYTGQEKDVGKPIYISTWQSMMNMPQSYLSQFDVVMIDEAHKVQAKSFDTILTRSTNAEWRIGLTGTIQDALCHKYKIEALLGQHKLLLTNLEARELGITTPIEVEGIVFEYSEEDRRTLQKLNRITKAEKKAGKKDKSYQNEIKFLIEHDRRNKFLCDLASQLEGNTIMLFNRIEHGTLLLQKLKKEHPKRDIFWVAGDVVKDDREELRMLMAVQKNAIIVASYGVFAQGVDISNLHNLMLCHPLESPRLLLQSLGRLGRKHASKSVATAYHFGDSIKIMHKNARDNHTLRHFKNCIKRYDRERIPYHLSKVRFFQT